MMTRPPSSTMRVVALISLVMVMPQKLNTAILKMLPAIDAVRAVQYTVTQKKTRTMASASQKATFTIYLQCILTFFKLLNQFPFTGPCYGRSTVGKCPGRMTLKGPTKDGCKIFWTYVLFTASSTELLTFAMKHQLFKSLKKKRRFSVV